MHRPTVLVLSPSTGGGFFGSIATGIASVVAEHDGHVVLVQTLELGRHSDDLGDPPDFALPIGWQDADAAITVTTGVRDGYLAALRAAGVPVVTISAPRGGAATARVVPDNAEGTALAVEHLLAHGHRTIGFIGHLVQPDIRDRHDAYLRTLRRHGLEPDPAHLIGTTDAGETGGAYAAEAFLALADRPTAVMCATDRNALAFMDAVRSAGVSVPADLAVAAFDDVEAAAFSDPPLTTVRQSYSEVGARAARLALDAAAGEPVEPVDHRVPARLAVRSSCGCARSHLTGADLAPAVADPSPVDPGLVVEHLAGLLAGACAGSPGVAHERASALVALARAIQHGPAPLRAVEDIRQALAQWRLAPRLERSVVHLLDEHLPPSVARAGVLARTWWHLESSAFLGDAASFAGDFQEQFRVDTALLGETAADPRSLTWLAGTHVGAGVLALWQDGSDQDALTVVGVHDSTGALGALHGTGTTARAFPPRALVELAAAAASQMCVVVPVRTATRHWGLLAVTGRIDTTAARETYHHWATLLGARLDQLDLQQVVRRSEQRYADVLRATNDGLWDMQLGTDEIDLSERGRELLAVGASVTGARAVLARVVPADQPHVRAAVAQAVSAPDQTFEAEFRVAVGGAERWRLMRGMAKADASGQVVRLVGSLSDIDERKRLEAQLTEAALFDAVTGLPNRRLFVDRLEVAVRQSRRHPTRGFAVLFVDLDGFKLVNDSLGHAQGDVLLHTVGQRLREELRASDTAARFGGDEFAVLLDDPSSGRLMEVVERLQRRVADPVVLGTEEVAVTASVGIAVWDGLEDNAEEMLRKADLAMYHAKSAERGSAARFDPSMTTTVSERLRLRGQLRESLAEGRFVVHYQPVVSLDGAAISHVEALVRWDHPERGHLLPAEFLPALEEGPGIVQLGRWVLDTVCAQLAEWCTDGRRVSAAVNVSHREFWARDVVEVVADALHRHGVPPHCLVLEITETVVMADVQAAHATMQRLGALGVRLHVDDFGTGQSSLHALRSFPVDALKIDGSFAARMVDDPQTAELVSVIVQMGRVLGLDVVAERIETAEQADALRAMGCGQAQGWLYARALPADEVGLLLGTTPTPAADAATGRVQQLG